MVIGIDKVRCICDHSALKLRNLEELSSHRADARPLEVLGDDLEIVT